MKIREPGIYSMPMDKYLADPVEVPSLSAGVAKLLLTRSPLHAWTAHPRLNPTFEAEESTKFDLGSATHALLLEGADRMAVIAADDWRKKEAQQGRDAARAEGRFPVLAHQYDNVLRMRDAALLAIARCSDLSGVTLHDGKPEQVLVWKEGPTWLRCRPDWLSTERDIQLHYKTTEASAAPDSWTRTMLGMAADLEIAFYDRGNAATGAPQTRRSLFLVQEVERPHACSFIGLAPAFLALAGQKVDEAIALWAQSMASGNWPAYANRIAWLDAPAYEVARWEGRQAEHPFGIEQNGEAYGRAFGLKEVAA